MRKIIILFVVAIIAVGGYLFFNRGEVRTPEGDTETTSLGVPAPGFEGVTEMIVSTGATEYTIRYNGSGFSPSSITIAKGDIVTFVNESNKNMWVASAIHPSHKVYGGTTLNEHCFGGASNPAFDQCSTGNSYSFTFDKTGKWGYHNHVRAGGIGTIVVVDEL